MTNVQSIIVYHNPVEAQLWEGGFMFPMMVGMVLSFFVVVIVASIFKKSKYAAHAAMVSIIATFSVVIYLMC